PRPNPVHLHHRALGDWGGGIVYRRTHTHTSNPIDTAATASQPVLKLSSGSAKSPGTISPRCGYFSYMSLAHSAKTASRSGGFLTSLSALTWVSGGRSY